MRSEEDDDEAHAAGLKFRAESEKTTNWYTARRVAETVSGYKTLVADETGCILGAHVVGPHADEIINILL